MMDIGIFSLDFNESHQAFVKHIEDQLIRTKGNEIVLITLVDEWGKESILNDTFYEHIIKYNSPKILYISFDFHEYWFEYFNGKFHRDFFVV